MPELPEVEASRRAIEVHCLGKKIKRSIVADDSKVIDGVSPSDFEAAILGKTIVSAHRKGKNLWLQLDSPPFPSFQFGMAGAIYIKGVVVTKYKRSAINDTDEWPSKYSKLFVELDDGLELSFTDKRRFAKVRLLKDPTSVPPISELGPDALFEPMTIDQFFGSLSKKKIAIKALLLDQSVISGIGNWIADEVLYQARIHPLQSVASLSKESCATLLKCIKEVLEKALEVGADSTQFPNNWIFHSHEKKPGMAFVDGKVIDFITAGGRTTAYVPELQKLSGGQAAKLAGEQTKQMSKRKGGRKDDDVDEPASEEEETAEIVKPKRESKSKGRTKKPPSKRNSKESEDDTGSVHSDGDDDDPASEEAVVAKSSKSKNGRESKQGGKKKPAAKRKARESDESDDQDNGEDEKRKRGKVTNDKQPKAASKKIAASQNGKRSTRGK
ncbi:formamidopyrimidine-DNA glycosylase isoform X1 [Tripterygium wilfordii]|uniref:Formamidopyrimidine-DNA glycosylase isoform X1 n=1 Tax=Tripterygium wilfordii TaxID=458696 RepID=A0A7J7CY97_TRIWF|nr:formamidopyrimidine-DNA glycosylase isoform X1 [Tripterygium wilfordii]KAF5739071.1 formamidopyrimidine-DNA glycosylase isoform X1 [Tripterygium wilfordii]